MTYGLIQTVGPYAEPVHLDEAKAHLRADGTAEGALIDSLVTAARKNFEGQTGRQLVTATYRLTLDGWPDDDVIRPPRAPLVSVSSVVYARASDGAATTLDVTLYQVDAGTEPGRIVPAYGEVWPALRDQLAAVTVTYVAGHATPFTADPATDVLTAKGRTYAAGDLVRLTNSGGALPAGLSALTDYYVRDVAGATFKLAATAGGSAVDVTGAGTGTHFLGEVPEGAKAAIRLILGNLNENRESTISGTIISAVPLALDSLLAEQLVSE